MRSHAVRPLQTRRGACKQAFLKGQLKAVLLLDRQACGPGAAGAPAGSDPATKGASSGEAPSPDAAAATLGAGAPMDSASAAPAVAAIPEEVPGVLSALFKHFGITDESAPLRDSGLPSLLHFQVRALPASAGFDLRASCAGAATSNKTLLAVYVPPKAKMRVPACMASAHDQLPCHPSLTFSHSGAGCSK